MNLNQKDNNCVNISIDHYYLTGRDNMLQIILDLLLVIVIFAFSYCKSPLWILTGVVVSVSIGIIVDHMLLSKKEQAHHLYHCNKTEKLIGTPNFLYIFKFSSTDTKLLVLPSKNNCEYVVAFRKRGEALLLSAFCWGLPIALLFVTELITSPITLLALLIVCIFPLKHLLAFLIPRRWYRLQND